MGCREKENDLLRNYLFSSKGFFWNLNAGLNQQIIFADVALKRTGSQVYYTRYQAF